MTGDDGLPSDEQLGRIQRGVMRRIDLRRLLARRIAGGAAAVLLVGGGIGLLATHPIGLSGASSGSAAGGSRAEDAAGSVVVRCAIHPGDESAGPASVRVPESRLPEAAVAGCSGTTVEFQAGSGGVSDSSAASAAPAAGRGSTPEPAVLCIDVDGSYVVLVRHGSARATCVAAGMEPFAG